MVPAPGSLSTVIVPLWLSMMPQITARPSPVPFCPLVEKKGSKSRGMSSLAMPLPVSATRSSTNSRSPDWSSALQRYQVQARLVQPSTIPLVGTSKAKIAEPQSGQAAASTRSEAEQSGQVTWTALVTSGGRPNWCRVLP